jgi:cytochrome c oxidase subunit II
MLWHQLEGYKKVSIQHSNNGGTKGFMKRTGWAAVFLLCAVFIQAVSATVAQDPARNIEIHAKRFSFSPAEITLKEGETVKLMVTSDDVTHSLVIPDLLVNAQASKDHPAEVTITPGQVGDFEGKCGHFCGKGHGSMKFVAHVTNGKYCPHRLEFRFAQRAIDPQRGEKL